MPSDFGKSLIGTLNDVCIRRKFVEGELSSQGSLILSFSIYDHPAVLAKGVLE